MSRVPRVDSVTTEEFEMRPPKPRLLSEYDSTYAVLENYDIEKAHRIISTKDWQNAEPFLNPWGSRQVTLVHFAACRGNLRMLERAALLHAPMYATDEFGRCALHYAASQGHAEVIKWLLEHSAGDRRPSGTEAPAHPQLSLRDHFGRTALHQATKGLHVAVVKILIDAGTNVNACDEQGVPPLLLACCNVRKFVRNDPEMISRYENIIEMLTAAGVNVTVVPQHTGLSALHSAVSLNSCKATAQLIKCGANPRCGRLGTTPLHLAATYGYHHTLRILLEALPSSPIDIPDKYGWSPLHQAAALGNLECVRALVDKGGNLAKETRHGSTVIDLLSMFKHDTNLAAFFTELLDANIRLVDKLEGPAQVVYEINLDFQVLAPEGQPQMGVVSSLMKALPRTEQITILQHPLLEVYLWQKWSHVRYFFYSFVIIHIVFVLLLTCYAGVLLRNGLESSILRRMMLFSALIPFCQIVMMFSIEPKRYCVQFENWLSLICVTMSIVVAVAGEFTANAMAISTSGNHNDQRHDWPRSWILHCLSFAILLAWIQMMMLASRFPAWGFYALIFSTVLKNVLKVFFIGIWIIIGFAFSFSVLFHGNDQFDNPFNAFVKTLVMMTGEYDYDNLLRSGRNNSMTDNLNSDKKQNISVPITDKIIFTVFVLLASIVLMNLMIGLAVNDIQGLVKEGQFSRLLKQAEFIAACEWMSSSSMFRCFPKHFCLIKLLKSNIARRKTLSWQWGKKRHQYISEKLWKDLFKLGLKNRDIDIERRNSVGAIHGDVQAVASKIAITQDFESRADDRYVVAGHPFTPNSSDYESLRSETLDITTRPRLELPVDRQEVIHHSPIQPSQTLYANIDIVTTNLTRSPSYESPIHEQENLYDYVFVPPIDGGPDSGVAEDREAHRQDVCGDPLRSRYFTI